MSFINMRSTSSVTDGASPDGAVPGRGGFGPLRAVIFAALAAVAASGLAYHAFDVDFLSLLPRWSACPFRNLTGLPCPGCGMTRAFLSIGQGRLGQALLLNPFSIPLLAGMALHLSGAGRGWVRAWPRRAEWLALVTVVLFWVYRVAQHLGHASS